MKKLIVLLLTVFSFTSCDTAFLDSLGTVYQNTGITNQETVLGLKDALIQGANNGSALVSKVDGYYRNPLIKIPWPEEAEIIKTTLSSIGLNSLVTDVERSINRAAEQAAAEAAPILVSAIKQMTINDALDILFGADNAATMYLQRTTTEDLTKKFQPVIDGALHDTEATRFWSEAVGAYNKIPLMENLDPDLSGFVTTKALDGLFLMIEAEEKKIREDPLARVTDIMEKVFGYYDENK